MILWLSLDRNDEIAETMKIEETSFDFTDSISGQFVASDTNSSILKQDILLYF